MGKSVSIRALISELSTLLATTSSLPHQPHPELDRKTPGRSTHRALITRHWARSRGGLFTKIDVLSLPTDVAGHDRWAGEGFAGACAVMAANRIARQGQRQPRRDHDMASRQQSQGDPGHVCGRDGQTDALDAGVYAPEHASKQVG